MKVINEFRREYRYLSNRWHSPFIDGYGREWPTVEHYYQAMKSVSYEDQETVRTAPTATIAKYIGYSLLLRPDWTINFRLNVMKTALKFKFSQNMALQIQLITLINRGYEIQQGNFHGDKFWGVDLKTGEGHNHLGRLLMEVGEEIIMERKQDKVKRVI